MCLRRRGDAQKMRQTCTRISHTDLRCSEVIPRRYLVDSLLSSDAESLITQATLQVQGRLVERLSRTQVLVSTLSQSTLRVALAGPSCRASISFHFIVVLTRCCLDI